VRAVSPWCSSHLVFSKVVSDLGVRGDLDVLDEFAEYGRMALYCKLCGVQAPDALKTAKRYWPRLHHHRRQQCPHPEPAFPFVLIALSQSMCFNVGATILSHLVNALVA